MGEERVLREIERWENEMSNYELNDFEKLYDEWMMQHFFKASRSTKEKLLRIH